MTLLARRLLLAFALDSVATPVWGAETQLVSMQMVQRSTWR